MNNKVRALLVEKGIKQKDIAEALDVSPGVVCGVIGGYFSSRRVRKAIADALQMPYEKVWGKKAA